MMDFKFKFGKPSTMILSEYVILIYFTTFVSTQVCDISSDDVQCDHGEICRDNRCEQAISCEEATHCSEPGTSCVNNYCQQSTCTSRGQCVHGQVCSRYGNGICLYPVHLKIPERTQFKIEFTEPAPKSMKYKEIGWMKGNSDSKSKIVFFHQEMTNNKPQYFNGYCKTPTNCDESNRVFLNINTGELVFSNVSLNDEGNYFYWFWVDSSIPDTGVKYQIHLEVYVVPMKKDLVLTGMPEEVEPGTEVELTCSVNRIKPEVLKMVWNTTIGQRQDEKVTTVQNKDSTYQCKSVVKYDVKEKYYRQKVQCTIAHVYGDSVYVRQMFPLKRKYKDVSTTTLETVTVKNSMVSEKIAPMERPIQSNSNGVSPELSAAVVVFLVFLVVALTMILLLVAFFFIFKKRESNPVTDYDSSQRLVQVEGQPTLGTDDDETSTQL